MLALPIELVALLILLLATVIRAVFGFGEAVLAVPLLALLVGLPTATPVVALLAATMTLVLLLRQWRHVDWQTAWQLILGSLGGIPVGVILLRVVPSSYGMSALGIFLVLYGGYSLLRPRVLTLPPGPWTYLFGVLAGIIGGAYSTNGPIVALYGTLRGWTPAQLRASLQAYFLITGWVIVAGHGMAGLWTPVVLKLYAAALPVVMVGLWLGSRLGRRLPGAAFLQLLSIFLIVIGILVWVRG
jgi:uncharacterized protein